VTLIDAVAGEADGYAGFEEGGSTTGRVAQEGGPRKQSIDFARHQQVRGRARPMSGQDRRRGLRDRSVETASPRAESAGPRADRRAPRPRVQRHRRPARVSPGVARRRRDRDRRWRRSRDGTRSMDGSDRDGADRGPLACSLTARSVGGSTLPPRAGRVEIEYRPRHSTVFGGPRRQLERRSRARGRSSVCRKATAHHAGRKRRVADR